MLSIRDQFSLEHTCQALRVVWLIADVGLDRQCFPKVSTALTNTKRRCRCCMVYSAVLRDRRHMASSSLMRYVSCG